MKKWVAALLVVVMMLTIALPGLADKKSTNPLLDPITLETQPTKDKFLNLLFLGLDVTNGEFRASGHKKNVMDAHTDVIMLLAINLTKERMDLVSIPRDTLCYVPGVHGVYKINAAFNTATNYNEGFRHVCDTVSYFMGGVKIDAYCAVDLNAMKTLADTMGGIDFELDMAYTGSSGREYKKGFQHLDGVGVVDYVRARKNASRDANDMGRTARNRAMMIAIFDKLKSDMNMIQELWYVQDQKDVFFKTNLKGAYVITDMWDFFQGIEAAEIGSHMITGVYQNALGRWDLNITNQAERVKLIKTLFGITSKELPFSSKAYCQWLLGPGFTAVHIIRQARLILDYAKLRKQTDSLKKLIDKLEKAVDDAVTTFDKCAARAGGGLTKTQIDNIKTAAKNVATESKYPDSYTWEHGKWYEDPLINDYNQINWR